MAPGTLPEINDDYNKKYGQGHSQNTSLSLGSTASGVGLALRF